MFNIELLDRLMSAMECDGYFKVTFHNGNEFILAHEVFEGKPYRVSIELEDENEVYNLDNGLMSYITSTSLDNHIKSYVDMFFGFTPIPSYTELVRGVWELDNKIVKVAVPRLKKVLGHDF